MSVVSYIIDGLTINFGITAVGYVLAAILQTEKFYDLTATGTLVLLTCKSLQWGGTFYTRQYFQSACAILWAVRYVNLCLLVIYQSFHLKFDWYHCYLSIKSQTLKYELI